MHKVKWNAKVDYEFVHNYKILQSVFNRLKIDKVRPWAPPRGLPGRPPHLRSSQYPRHPPLPRAQHIDVDKLIRAKYQDNLEFMQWMKRFYDLNCPEGTDYDPVARRQIGKGLSIAAPARAPCLTLCAGTFTTPANVTRKRVTGGAKSRGAPPSGTTAPVAAETGEKENRALNRGGAGGAGGAASTRPAAARRGGAADRVFCRRPFPLWWAPVLGDADGALSCARTPSAATAEVARKLKKRLAEMKLIVRRLCWGSRGEGGLRPIPRSDPHPSTAGAAAQVEGLEKERDFYFGKLRDIEVLLQVDETADAATLREKVFKILCAAAASPRAPFLALGTSLPVHSTCAPCTTCTLPCRLSLPQRASGRTHAPCARRPIAAQVRCGGGLCRSRGGGGGGGGRGSCCGRGGTIAGSRARGWRPGWGWGHGSWERPRWRRCHRKRRGGSSNVGGRGQWRRGGRPGAGRGVLT